ncbi:MAG: SET domain-containing protein-lysine N-methyltransferase [Candidatus Methanoperedens sp.]|nr:SET domain-containing protein-lysine N-methyltransferase [Candidatus Methanoperedens sp.]
MNDKKIPALIEHQLLPELGEISRDIKAVNDRIDSLEEKIESLINDTKTDSEELRKKILYRFDSLEQRILVVEIRPSQIHGVGLFALRTFEAGDTICTGRGEIIKTRIRSSIELNANEHFDPTGIVEGPINAIAKANHACYPNSYVQYDSKSGFLILKALTNILVYEEITIDYCATENELAYPFDCKCGNPNCRKYIDCKHDLRSLGDRDG